MKCMSDSLVMRDQLLIQGHLNHRTIREIHLSQGQKIPEINQTLTDQNLEMVQVTQAQADRDVIRMIEEMAPLNQELQMNLLLNRKGQIIKTLYQINLMPEILNKTQ